MTMKEQKRVPKLRFAEFSGEWKIKPFKELVKINQGLQISISERLLEKEEGSLFYITNEFLRENSDKKYFIKNAPESVICKKNDVLMTRTGNTGKVVTNVEGAFHNNFFKIAYPKSIDKNFLVNFLNLQSTQNYILRLAGTSTIPDLNHSDFYRINMTFPSKGEQQKIASFLSAVDKKIAQLQQKKRLLEDYKKGVMQQIFSQKLRFTKDNGSAYPDWEEKRLGEIGETLNGLTGKTKENFGKGKPYIQYKQIFDGSKINVDDCGLVDVGENERQTRVEFGDVFFTTSSETPNEIGTASVLLDEVKEMYLNSFCFGLRIKQKLLKPSFAQFLFRSSGFRKKMIPLAQGSTRYNISKSSFLKLKVELPSIEEQTQIAHFLSAIDTKIAVVQNQIEKTQIFKKGLLQQMFV